MDDAGVSRLRIELDTAGVEAEARALGQRITRAIDRSTTGLRRTLERQLSGIRATVDVTADAAGAQRQIRRALAPVEDLRVRVTADTQGLDQSVQRATGAVGAVRVPVSVDDAQARSEVSGLGGRLSGEAASAGSALGVSLGAAMAGAIAAAVAGAGAIVRVAGDFESAMNGVRAVSGATGEQLEALRQTALDLGSTTSFSAGEAAAGLEELAKAGLSADQAMGAIEGTLSLAAAGQLELAQASDIATNVMAGFGLAAEDVGRISDALATAATSSSTDVEGLGEAFKGAGPAGVALGLELEQVAAAIGIMANAGFRGENAATGLAAVFGQLSIEGSKADKVFKRFGIEIENADGSVKDFSEILIEAREAGLSYNDAIEAFGSDHGRKFGAALGQSEADLRAVDDALKDTAGSAEEMADIRLEGFQGSVNQLKAAWEGLLIALGDTGILSAATGGVERLTDVVSGLSGAVSDGDLDEVIGGVAERVSELVSAVSGTGVFDSLRDSAAAALKVLVALSPALSAFGAVTSGALVAGLSAASVALDAVSAVLEPMAGWMRDNAAAVGAFGAALAGVFVAVRVVSAVAATVNILRNALAAARVAMLALNVTMLANPIFLIIAAVAALAAGLVYLYQNVEPVRNAIDGLFETVSGFVSGVISGIQEFPGAVAEYLVGVWEDVVTGTGEMVGSVVEFFTNLPGQVVSGLANFGGDLYESFSGAGATAKSAVTDFIGDAVESFVSLPGRVVSGLANFGRELAGSIASAGRSGRESVETFISDAVKSFTGMPGRIVSGLSTLGARIGGAISGAWTTVRKRAENLVARIVAIFRGLPRKIVEAVGDIGSEIMGSIRGGLSSGVANLLPLNLLANGAMVDRPTLAVVGEAGPELVVPLTRPQRARQLVEESGLMGIIGGGGGVAPVLAPGGGAAVVRQGATHTHTHHWTLNQVGDPETTARRVVRRMALAAGGM